VSTTAFTTNFGWVPPELRTDEQKAAHESAVLAMPEFRIVGSRSDSDRAYLWEFAKPLHGGEHLVAFFQETGSCVGNGLGQAIEYLQCVEIVRLGDREKPLTPFWLLPYGRSRYYGGLRGRGDGSFGSTAARAAKDDGFLDAEDRDLPQPYLHRQGDGRTWGAKAEMDWSDGARIPESYLSKSRKHIVHAVAQAKSADDVREGLRNGYPATIASDWGGQMRCPVQEDRLMNRRSDTWHHQMMVLAWENHPRLGEIFYILNSWGRKAHGVCPSGAPPGGFWVKKAELEYIVRQGETFIFSQFDGFPAQEIEKSLFRIMG
jgi:hypothetical protein